MNNFSPRFPSDSACRPCNIVFKTQNPNCIFHYQGALRIKHISGSVVANYILLPPALSFSLSHAVLVFQDPECSQEQEAIVLVVNQFACL